MESFRKADVVVVGAGFSGIQAATDIVRAGFTCLVVEALDRIGGKSYTKPLTSGRGHIEMGCTWIDGTTQERMSALVKKYDLELVQQHIHGLEVHQDFEGRNHLFKHGEAPEDLPVEELLKAAEINALIQFEADKFDTKTPGALLDSNNRPDTEDCTVDHWLRKKGVEPHHVAYQVPRAVCAGIFGREPTEISVYLYFEEIKTCVDFQQLQMDMPGGAQALKIRTGTSSIIHNMAKELKPNSILLGHLITQIRQEGNHCTLATAKGMTIDCSKVILTAPFNTWSTISFSPPLSKDKLTLAANGLAGYYSKMVLTYARPWWKELGLLGKFSCWKGRIMFSWDVSDATFDQYSLALFVISNAHNETTKDPLQRQKLVLDELAGMIPEQHRDLVYDILEINDHDWDAFPSIGAVCYSGYGAGLFETIAPTLWNPFRNVHFAGTGTASHWRGYMEGAVQSGERAAAEIIQALSETSTANGSVKE